MSGLSGFHGLSREPGPGHTSARWAGTHPTGTRPPRPRPSGTHRPAGTNRPVRGD